MAEYDVSFEAKMSEAGPIQSTFSEDVGMFTATFGSVSNVGMSVSPYNETPEMDGIASPGDVNKYSRGNHVHPSDDNKVNVGDVITNLEIQDILNKLFK